MLSGGSQERVPGGTALRQKEEGARAAHAAMPPSNVGARGEGEEDASPEEVPRASKGAEPSLADGIRLEGDRWLGRDKDKGREKDKERDKSQEKGDPLREASRRDHSSKPSPGHAAQTGASRGASASGGVPHHRSHPPRDKGEDDIEDAQFRRMVSIFGKDLMHKFNYLGPPPQGPEFGEYGTLLPTHPSAANAGGLGHMPSALGAPGQGPGPSAPTAGGNPLGNETHVGPSTGSPRKGALAKPGAGDKPKAGAVPRKPSSEGSKKLEKPGKGAAPSSTAGRDAIAPVQGGAGSPRKPGSQGKGKGEARSHPPVAGEQKRPGLSGANSPSAQSHRVPQAPVRSSGAVASPVPAESDGGGRAGGLREGTDGEGAAPADADEDAAEEDTDAEVLMAIRRDLVDFPGSQEGVLLSPLSRLAFPFLTFPEPPPQPAEAVQGSKTSKGRKAGADSKGSEPSSEAHRRASTSAGAAVGKPEGAGLSAKAEGAAAGRHSAASAHANAHRLPTPGSAPRGSGSELDAALNGHRSKGGSSGAKQARAPPSMESASVVAAATQEKKNAKAQGKAGREPSRQAGNGTGTKSKQAPSGLPPRAAGAPTGPSEHSSVLTDPGRTVSQALDRRNGQSLAHRGNSGAARSSVSSEGAAAGIEGERAGEAGARVDLHKRRKSHGKLRQGGRSVVNNRDLESRGWGDEDGEEEGDDDDGEVEDESWAKGGSRGSKGKRKRRRGSSGDASALADAGPEARRRAAASSAHDQKLPSSRGDQKISSSRGDQKLPSSRGAPSASAASGAGPGAPGAEGAVTASSRGEKQQGRREPGLAPKARQPALNAGGVPAPTAGSIVGALGAVSLAGASTLSSSSSSSSTLAATESGAAAGLGAGEQAALARPTPTSAAPLLAGAALDPGGAVWEAALPDAALVPAPVQIFDWVECDSCKTWRLLPPQVKPERFEHFECTMNDWTPALANCGVEEDATTAAVYNLLGLPWPPPPLPEAAGVPGDPSLGLGNAPVPEAAQAQDGRSGKASSAGGAGGSGGRGGAQEKGAGLVRKRSFKGGGSGSGGKGKKSSGGTPGPKPGLTRSRSRNQSTPPL